MSGFGDYQLEIYRAGASGSRPHRSFDHDRLRAAARDALTPEAWGYAAGGAGSGATMRANREALDRRRLVPRTLRGVAERDLSCELLGRRHVAPLLVAPIGIQTIVHPEGELATARAAAAVGLTLVQSTVGSFTMEQVAEAAGDGRRWFQLYWPAEPALADSFLARAEAAGYEAVVVTLDTLQLGWRPRDLDHGYLPFLVGEGIANYLADPVFLDGLARPPAEDPAGVAARFGAVFSDPSLTWDDLRRLRERTRLPVLVKGVLAADDARRARDAGVDGVIVSNHGGRQVDGAIGAADALPAIADAVGDELAVLMDSGVRGGADVVKVLALGARAVLLGRPWLWGLAVGGEAGVAQVLRGTLAELDLTMMLVGARRPGQLGPSLLSDSPRAG